MNTLYEAAFVARALDFGYANARVKAMKQSLLSSKELASMVEAGSADEVYSALEKTQYRPDLVSGALLGKSSADRIELACTRNFSRMLKKIRAVTPKKARQKIVEMFEKYDIDNIKTILVSRHAGEPKEKTADLITETGVLSRGALNRMLDAKTVKDAVAELGGTAYGTVLEKALKRYEKEREITVLTAALDDYYYRKLPRIAKNPYGDERIILSMLRSQADAKNISNILRAKKAGLKEDAISQMLIGEGTVGKDTLMQAVNAKGVEDAMKVFEKTHRLAKAIEVYRKSGSLIPAELELEKAIARKGLGTLRASVLSLGAIAGFLFLKEQEVSNIRKIARAKEFNLPAEKIREMIVAV